MSFSYASARRKLQEEQRKLHEQLARLEAAQTAQYEDIGYSNHIADDATDAFEQTVGVALQRKVETTLDEVTQALSKLDDGTYGLCETCGARIDRARLEALPHARHCMDCQARQEHAGTRVGSR